MRMRVVGTALAVALLLISGGAAWGQEGAASGAGAAPEPAGEKKGAEEKNTAPAQDAAAENAGSPAAEPVASGEKPPPQASAASDEDLFDILEGEVEIRGQAITNTDQASKFLEYRDEPSGVLGERIALRTRARADDDYYFSLLAEDVAERDGSVGWTFGKVGDWKVTFDYNRIVHHYGFAGKTLYAGVGTNNLRLADQIQTDLQGTTPGNPSALLRNFAGGSDDLDDELRQQRERLKLRFEYTAIENVTLYTEMRYEDKDGTRPFGASMGFGHFEEIPLPLDAYTLEAEIGAIYREGAFDAVLSYTFSRYDSRYRSVTWDNPFRIVDSTTPGAFSSTNQAGASLGRITLDPDNVSHMVNLRAGYDLPWWETRITAETSAQWRLTDDPLEPFTTNSAIRPPVAGVPFAAFDPANLPVDEFDGEINVQNYAFTATSRPTRELDLRLKGSHRRQNDDSEKWRSPGYVRTDATWVVSQQENERFQYAKTTGALDAGYEVDALDTRFSAGYQYDRWDRDHRDVDYSDERTYRAAAETRWTPDLKTKFGYSWAWRDRSSVDDPLPAELPFLRRADWSTRGRHKPTAKVSWSPTDEIEVGTQYAYIDENYHVHFGLRDVVAHEVELDFTYTPTEHVSVALFLGYAHYLADQRSRQWSPGGAGDPFTGPPGFPSPSNWDAVEVTDTYTTGFNAHWAFVPDRWALDVGYVFAKNRSDIDMESPLGTSAANDANFRLAKDLNDAENSQRHTVTMEVGFTPSQRFRVAFGYELDVFRLDNFYDDGLNPVPITPTGGFAGGYLLNNRFEDAEVHLFYLSGSYKF